MYTVRAIRGGNIITQKPSAIENPDLGLGPKQPLRGALCLIIITYLSGGVCFEPNLRDIHPVWITRFQRPAPSQWVEGNGRRTVLAQDFAQSARPNFIKQNKKKKNGYFLVFLIHYYYS